MASKNGTWQTAVAVIFHQLYPLETAIQLPKKKKDTFPCFPNVIAISLSLSPEGAIQAGKDGVSDATDAEDATVAAVASAGVDQASLVVVGGWWLVEKSI